MIYTSDTTQRGQMIARNSMRIRLWDDDEFSHRWLCHPARNCADGCDEDALPDRLAFYRSAMEDL